MQATVPVSLFISSSLGKKPSGKFQSVAAWFLATPEEMAQGGNGEEGGASHSGEGGRGWGGARFWAGQVLPGEGAVLAGAQARGGGGRQAGRKITTEVPYSTSVVE